MHPTLQNAPPDAHSHPRGHTAAPGHGPVPPTWERVGRPGNTLLLAKMKTQGLRPPQTPKKVRESSRLGVPGSGTNSTRAEAAP